MAKKTKRMAMGGPTFTNGRAGGMPSDEGWNGQPGAQTGYGTLPMGRDPNAPRAPRDGSTGTAVSSFKSPTLPGYPPPRPDGGYKTPSMDRDPNASTRPRMVNPGTSSTGSVGATTRPINPNPTPVQLLRKGGAVKKSKRMAMGGPVPAASRLPSGKRGAAYSSKISGKMADAESRMDSYEAPEFKSARRAEYNANKMDRRSANASDRLSALSAKGYKRGGKVKRMAEGGLPEDAPITTTSAPIGYGKGTEGPGMYKGPYRAAPMPNPIATTRPTPGPRPPHMDKDEREAKREDRRENRDERREERRSRMRDRFEAFKDRRGGQLGFKGWNQLLGKMPEDFMAKYGDRIGDFMSERFNKAPKLGGELPPTTMKRGGRVKASAAPKRFAKGGLVKGAGCASRGVKKARIV